MAIYVVYVAAIIRCTVVQVLQTGQEITELDSSGFVTSSPTVFAGNIGEKKYILQVSICLFVCLFLCLCMCL